MSQVSAGTARNLKYYDFEKLQTVTLTDSSEKMLDVARSKLTERALTKVSLVTADAQDLSQHAENASFDTVIDTFGLCSHEDPVRALREMARVTRPGGKILLLEHGRSSWPFLNK